jgi:hypothetical protein
VSPSGCDIPHVSLGLFRVLLEESVIEHGLKEGWVRVVTTDD